MNLEFNNANLVTSKSGTIEILGFSYDSTSQAGCLFFLNGRYRYSLSFPYSFTTFLTCLQIHCGMRRIMVLHGQ